MKRYWRHRAARVLTELPSKLLPKDLIVISGVIFRPDFVKMTDGSAGHKLRKVAIPQGCHAIVKDDEIYWVKSHIKGLA